MTCATAATPLFKNRFKKCLSHSFLRPVYLFTIASTPPSTTLSTMTTTTTTTLSTKDDLKVIQFFIAPPKPQFLRLKMGSAVAVKRLKFGRLIYFYSFSSYTTV